MTILELREQLEILLVTHLGQYKRKDGTTMPALWVGEFTPDGHSINRDYDTLIECLISPAPSLEQSLNYSLRY
ncbi:MAG: hypothetical protein ACRCZG_05720, partial [Culicoidibacterales bacterium]